MPDDYDAFLIWKRSVRQEIDDFRKERNAYRAENAKLREDLEDQEGYDQMLRDRLRQQTELHVKAEAENAKLRDERERMYKANVEKNGEILRLLEENAKLRELCARMFKDFVSCDCELRARAGRTFMAFTRYAPELRELGIEVDK